MYLLLIVIHSLFIGISHLFGFYIIEGVFLVLMLFFLLYFSPIFFFKKWKETQDIENLFAFELSPQKSLIIPLVLTYLGIYILAFTFSASISQSIQTHLLIFLAIFAIFLGYIFSFSWKNEVFFHVLGFHLVFSYITLAIIGVYYFFARELISWVTVIFSLVTIGFSYFFFLFDTKYRKEFFMCFLVSVFIVLKILLLFLFPALSLYVLLGVLGIFAIILFEVSEKHAFFAPFLKVSRIFFLSVVLGVVALLSVLIFWNFSSIYFLLVFVLFLLSVHMRFSNVVAYGAAIATVFWLYGFVFVSLLSVHSVFNSLIFIYFLSLLAIGNTYFWKEKQQYDFMILHYVSIAFSAIGFGYALIFLDWWKGSFIFSSFGFLLLAALFFLSYFRFYYKK